MSWRFLYRFACTRWFYSFAQRLSPFLFFVAFLCTSIGVIWGLFFTPPDYLQGHSYRIIFVHVPCASLALSLYVAMAVAGMIGFIWKTKIAYLSAKSLATIGCGFCFLALVSGSVWGKPTWGTWWVWDARLTSMLILFFLYLGQIGLRQSMSREIGNQACAILGIIGLVNIPIIKFSVEWWQTLHQSSSFTTKGVSIATIMLYPLIISLLGFYLIAFYLFLSRMKTEILALDFKKQWIKKLIRPIPSDQ